MAAPNPSPHRFIAPGTTPKPKPSTLRTAVTHNPHANEQQIPARTPAKRFVLAPTQRPHASASRASDRVEDAEQLSQRTPLVRAQRRARRAESIEEPSQSSPVREGEGEGVMTSTEDGEELGLHSRHGLDEDEDGVTHDSESEGEHEGEDDDEDNEILFPTPLPKRRRLSSPANLQTSNPRTTPPLPTTTAHSTPPPTAPAPAAAAATTAVSVPPAPAPAHRFLLPTHSTTQPTVLPHTLPDVFSPARKKGTYVPGARAATVRGWLVATAAAAEAASVPTSAATGRVVESGVSGTADMRSELRVRIVALGRRASDPDTQADREECAELEVLHNTTLFALAAPLYSYSSRPSPYPSQPDQKPPQENMHLLLAPPPPGPGHAHRSSSSTASARMKIRVGDVLGVRMPRWEVDVGGRVWVVCVEWCVL